MALRIVEIADFCGMRFAALRYSCKAALQLC
jgi:hypothetical protein